MADVTAEQARPGTAMARGDDGAAELQSDKGLTTIADPVVTKVAGPIYSAQ